MRNISAWQRDLARRLKEQWQAQETRIGPAALCDIELGLTLLETLAPGAPAQALWPLLAGYPFPTETAAGWGDDERRMIANARHLLAPFRSPFPWRRALGHYRQLDERLRGFQIERLDLPARRREVSLCASRWETYTKALREPIPYARTEVRWAKPGAYGFAERRRRGHVAIPADLPLPPRPSGHQLPNRSANPPIEVTHQELIDTARWMDETLTPGEDKPGPWERRISRVQLDLFDTARTRLCASDALHIDGRMHLIGMVSSGKSTLMDVLAVWAARTGQQITIVVGDVISALDRADLYTRLGLRAAPILGASNRELHINRLHRALTALHPATPLSQQHHGFRWLSTTCLLDGMRDTATPIQIGQQPCLRLYPSISDEDEGEQGRPQACPLYGCCTFHQAQRDLVDAAIWIATPASLVYTRVAPQLNQEQLRFAELVYRRSDLVIVDEVDQVQVQLDNIFSPSQTLVSRGNDAWLSRLSQQVLQRINQEGRGQLGDERVAAWCQAHDIAQTAASRAYALLLQSPVLQREIEQDYFTGWIILERVAFAMSGPERSEREQHPGYIRLMRIFERFVDDPLGEREEQDLADLARQTLTMSLAERVRGQISTWIENNREPGVDITERLPTLALLVEFALVASVLSTRLDLLLREWRFVERPLQLDGDNSFLFHRPPEDYLPVIPAAPMGNVLAFQYLRSGDDPNGAGDLRFFRCMGVGRWLLLHLHELFAGDGIAGPNVLLLSGTSWAGSAPGYHVQAPVDGILRAPEREVAAIARSQFVYQPFHDREGRAIRVSGSRGQARATAINTILQQLARRSGLGGPSRFERVRDKLPTGRQRILLLVGSYEEARAARTFLEQMRPDWKDKVLHLVSDDRQFESQWRSESAGLQRGLVHRFAETGAWILIAPMLAVERGHNILNDQDQAAIGAAYFLVRPHPRPDDIGFAIHSINQWAVARHNDEPWLRQICEGQPLSVELVGTAFREAAYRQWRYLLRLPMMYSTLPDRERDAVTWNQLVSIWQVIGRLIRGGVEAEVYFCDAAFKPETANTGEYAHKSPSLLGGMSDVLKPYFTSQAADQSDATLVQALYGPFYQALAREESH